MAGNYPNAPDTKAHYHEDGSAGFVQYNTGGPVTTLNSGQLQNANGEGFQNWFVADSNQRVGIIFPCLFDVHGLFVAQNGNDSTAGVVRTSTDTTSGADGTWTTATSSLPVYANIGLRWRTDVAPVTLNAIRAFTVSMAGGIGSCRGLHVYGRPSAGEAPDRLQYWDPVIDAPVAAAQLDYGDLARNQTGVQRFRVKNTAPSLTAHGINVTAAAITSASPALASQTAFSTNGSTYTATINLGDLAPGALTVPVFCRLALAPDASLSVWRQRVKAAATSWS